MSDHTFIAEMKSDSIESLLSFIIEATAIVGDDATGDGVIKCGNTRIVFTKEDRKSGNYFGQTYSDWINKHCDEAIATKLITALDNIGGFKINSPYGQSYICISRGNVLLTISTDGDN